ncbi:hypothetical protein LZ31DRAFT_592222 [Colletotrichum somersetense]|nr:hypothetical protein LZ31DRAFT_592222 [Colletotrichum somersetense]
MALETEVGPLVLGALTALLGRTGFDVASAIIQLRQCATAMAEANGVTGVFPGGAEMCLVVYNETGQLHSCHHKAH